ncbi:hypothetical protein MTR_6g053020 [Medicago truncatula]|uniref:Uncharacterized protein n=1 Tax=Medicago truncatula TaxID=3880 RepID=A0A072U996_MEDTR|nr:hypothetical protein MTR_6g053020 [Medicago truncatula]
MKTKKKRVVYDALFDYLFYLGSQNWDFGVKNRVFPRATCHNSPWRVDLLAGASSSLTAPPVSCSCIFFTRFCFELAFRVNMKVVDNFVSCMSWSKLIKMMKSKLLDLDRHNIPKDLKDLQKGFLDPSKKGLGTLRKSPKAQGAYFP